MPAPPLAERPLASALRPSGPLLGLLILLVLFFILLTRMGQLDRFFSLPNIQTVLHKNSIPAVAALGMLLVIICGGIDLSVGSVVALVTVVTMQTFNQISEWDGPPAVASLVAVAAGLASGAVCGLLNGVVITRLRVTPFVATLGMLSVARGVAIWLAGRTRVSFDGPSPGWVTALARTGHPWLVFDPGVWSVPLLAVGVLLLLRFTVFGRYVQAIGASEAAARRCGVDVETQRIWVYAIAGLLAGWAGVLMFAHGNGGDPNGAVGLELDVIAAVVIGGASLSGGQGTVGGTLLGVLILGLLENGVQFCRVPVEVKYILVGSIIIVNTALSALQVPREKE
jgi:ribose transport system permease protein